MSRHKKYKMKAIPYAINGAWLTETMTDVSSDEVEVTFTVTTPGGTTTHKTTTGIA